MPFFPIIITPQFPDHNLIFTQDLVPGMGTVVQQVRPPLATLISLYHGAGSSLVALEPTS